MLSFDDARLQGQSVLHAEHLVPVRCSEQQALLEVTFQIEFVVFGTLYCCEVTEPIDVLSLHRVLCRTCSVSNVIRAENDVTSEMYKPPLHRTHRPARFLCQL